MPSAAFMKALANSQKKVAKAIRDPKTAGTIKYVKTSSPRLNGTYGSGKGIAIGRIHRLMGPESGGKTAICTFVQKEFQQKLDVQHPELGKKPISVWIDFEGFDNAHATEMGLDTTSVFDGFDDKGNPIWNKDGRFLLVQPDSIEDAGVAIEELVRSGEVGSIVFDSESLATTRTIQENEMGKATFGGKAKMLGEFLTKFNILCRNYDTTMFIISQERANMAMMSHAIVTCVTPDTMLEVYEENELAANNLMMSMENLFKKVGFNYKDMTPWEFYDISDRKLYTASYNEKENKIEKKLIQGIVYKGIHPIFEVRTKSGDVILKGSPNHKVFDCATNKYKELKDTKCVTVLNRQQQPIDCVVVNTGREEPIVDISVEGNENYFSNGILSHNTGGYALRYAASTLNRVKKVCDLKDGTGKMIGIQMNVRNYKNKTGIPFRENDMWLYFDRGFDAEGEYIDLVKELQTDPRITALCKIGGAYWKSDKWGWSYKSKDSFISDFVHNEACKDMWEEMKNVIDEVLSGAIESDKETGDPEQMAEQNETYMDSAEARAEINSYKEVEQATQDSIVKKEDGLVTESETPEVTLSEVD